MIRRTFCANLFVALCFAGSLFSMEQRRGFSMLVNADIRCGDPEQALVKAGQMECMQQLIERPAASGHPVDGIFFIGDMVEAQTPDLWHQFDQRWYSPLQFSLACALLDHEALYPCTGPGDNCCLWGQKLSNPCYCFDRDTVRFIVCGQYPNAAMCEWIKLVALKGRDDDMPVVFLFHYPMISHEAVPLWSMEEKRLFLSTIQFYNVQAIITGYERTSYTSSIEIVSGGMDGKQVPVLGVGGSEFLVLLHTNGANNVRWRFRESFEVDEHWQAAITDVPRWPAERIDIIQS